MCYIPYLRVDRFPESIFVLTLKQSLSADFYTAKKPQTAML